MLTPLIALTVSVAVIQDQDGKREPALTWQFDAGG